MNKKKAKTAAKIVVGSTAVAGVGLFAFCNLLYDQMFTAKAMAKSYNPIVLEPAEKERYL